MSNNKVAMKAKAHWNAYGVAGARANIKRAAIKAAQED